MGASQGLDTGQVYKCCDCLPLDRVATKRGIEGVETISWTRLCRVYRLNPRDLVCSQQPNPQ